MKKIIYLLITTTFIFSCTNESVNETEPTQQLTLKQVNYVYVGTPADCEGEFADFDAQGKIQEIYSSCYGSVVTTRTYIYTDSGLIESIAEGFGGVEFIYENDVLVRDGTGNDTGSIHMEFTYNGNLMIGDSYLNGEPESYYYSVYEFEDDSYTKLLTIKGYNNSSGSDDLVSRITYQYDGNNPIEIFIESTPYVGSTMEPNRKVTITYDDNNNPYKKGLSENAYLAEHTAIRSLVIDYNLAYSADNNITSIVFEDLVQNTSFTHTYSYQYNSDLYPIESMFFNNGEFRRTDYFEYY